MVLTKVVLVLAAFYEHVPAIFLTVLVIWDCTAGRQANPKEVVAWKNGKKINLLLGFIYS